MPGHTRLFFPSQVPLLKFSQMSIAKPGAIRLDKIRGRRIVERCVKEDQITKKLCLLWEERLRKSEEQQHLYRLKQYAEIAAQSRPHRLRTPIAAGL
jgi:hypothetical protein